MDLNTHETHMTRRRALGLFAGGLLALTVRQVSAQDRPKPPDPEPDPEPEPEPTPPETAPLPTPSVVTIYVPVATQRKPRKPRKRRGTRKRH